VIVNPANALQIQPLCLRPQMMRISLKFSATIPTVRNASPTMTCRLLTSHCLKPRLRCCICRRTPRPKHQPGRAIVNFTATATDARDTNLVVTCIPPSGSQFALGGNTVNCSATNSRNKTAEGSFTVSVVDTTAPVVVLNGITNGATYNLGAVPAASCSTTDSATGVLVPAALSITGGTANGVGHFTATCSGAKMARQYCDASKRRLYDVDYLFNGFFSPVSTNKIFKLGSTVPLKWTLQNAQQGFISSFSSVAAVQAAPDPSCLAV